jgi:hypothetical protein
MLLAKSLAIEESLLATLVTPWRTLSFTSSKSGVFIEIRRLDSIKHGHKNERSDITWML